MSGESKDRSLVARISARLKKLERRADIKFGQVATVTPLTVYLDGDIDDGVPVATPARAMVSAVAVGDLVLCMEQDRQVTVFAVQP